MLDPKPPPLSTLAGSTGRRPPGWALELLDVVTLRRWIVVGVAVAVGVSGSFATALAPEVLPAHPLAGAAVGMAGCLLGIAAAVAADAGDRTIRGARHVHATGAVLAASITGTEPNPELISWVERLVDSEEGLRLAVSTIGSDALRAGQLADELGAALARRGRHVLVADLEQEEQAWPGASEVCSGEARLADAVEFHPTLRFARLGPGRDRGRALDELPALAARLPHDVDVFIVALPGLRRLCLLPAVTVIDRALLLIAGDLTTRVELLAALDVLDEVGLTADVVLVRSVNPAKTSEPVAGADAMQWEPTVRLLRPPPDAEGSGEIPPDAREAHDGVTGREEAEAEASAPDTRVDREVPDRQETASAPDEPSQRDDPDAMLRLAVMLGTLENDKES